MSKLRGSLEWDPPFSVRLVSIRSVSILPSSRGVLFGFVLSQFVASRFAAFRPAPCAVRFVSVWTRPPLGSSRFGTGSVLEFKLVECRARFDCDHFIASRALGQLEFKIQISSVTLSTPRMT